jgi:Fic family protein
VRRDGDWEAWLDFFYQGIAETSEAAVITAKSLLALFKDDRKAIQSTRVAASVSTIHHYLQGHPIASSGAICKAEGLSPATVNKALDHLVGLGLVKEITGGQRNRLFAYERVMKILAEGT